MARFTAKVRKDGSVLTGKCRLSFPHLFEKWEKSDKYQCVLLIPKDDKESVKVIKKAIEDAKERGLEELWKDKLPKGYLDPLKDGDEEDYDGYENCYYISCKTNSRPHVYDESGADVIDEEDVYAGCYVRGIVSFFPFDNNSKGVGVILKAVKKVDDGEPFGAGNNTSADDFDDGEDDDDFMD